ncbi:hypothetical protein C8R43DRAFT_944431 [Mycena crocata]|nr:hypothetical protein C8R43DRAFT_944431 [Mycena crocata]
MACKRKPKPITGQTSAHSTLSDRQMPHPNYIGNDGQLEECLIDFHELIGAHSGENMADVVWDTVTKFGLCNRIIVFVMDNTTNNDTLVEAFKRKCHELNIAFESKHAHNSLLLEAIGALMKEEHKKAVATSCKLACQDSTTESLLAKADNHNCQSGDSPDDAAANLNAAGATLAKPTSLIGLAVFKHCAAWKKEIKDVNANTRTEDSILMLIPDVKTH